MYRFLVRPRWLLATVTVLSLVAIFSRLGFWQLDRHSERQVENSVIAARLAAPPEPFDLLIRAVGDELDSLEYRTAFVEGEFAADREVLLRGQAHDGSPGFDVVTPFITPDGTTVLVNRGWVPLAFDTPPVREAAPPEGRITIGGVIRLNQEPSRFGPVEVPGTIQQIARIDLDRLSQQFEQLAPVWLEITESVAPLGPTIAGSDPAVDDNGPHVEYAVQWFGFAAIALFGYAAVVRRASRREAEQ